MIVQYVTALPAFNPHGGPITHSSSGSKPDSPVHPLFPKLFLTRGLVCNSWATFRWDHQSGIWRNTYSHCSESLSHFVSDIERLPIRLKLLMVPSYFALDNFLSFNTRDTYASPLELIVRWSIMLESVLIEFFPSYLFVSPVKILKEGRQLHHDALMQRNEDITKRDQLLREEQPRPRRLDRF